MTNNLRKISQDLRTFAKRTKDFKYTDSALIYLGQMKNQVLKIRLIK